MIWGVPTDDNKWRDCGRPKTRQAECCMRCGELDGTRARGASMFPLIQYLRTTDGVVSIEAAAHATGRTPRGIQASFRILEGRGRLAQLDIEDESGARMWRFRG